LLRARLAQRRFRTAVELAACRHGTPTRACGIVNVRQRPGTANGTCSLDDETGSINVIVWPSLVEKQRKALLGSSLLAVYGVLQRDDGVATDRRPRRPCAECRQGEPGEMENQRRDDHLVAHRLEDQSELLCDLATASHVFH
jgi:error-prone DNA polymerase